MALMVVVDRPYQYSRSYRIAWPQEEHKDTLTESIELCHQLNDITVQRREFGGCQTLSGAKMGDKVNCLGKVGKSPSLLCVAVKRKLNGIGLNEEGK